MGMRGTNCKGKGGPVIMSSKAKQASRSLAQRELWGWLAAEDIPGRNIDGPLKTAHFNPYNQ